MERDSIAVEIACNALRRWLRFAAGVCDHAASTLYACSVAHLLLPMAAAALEASRCCAELNDASLCT